MAITIDAFGRTDTGLVRQNNEDSFALGDIVRGLRDSSTQAIDDALCGDGAVLVVADGMGGLEAGEVASSMAVTLVATKLMDELRNAAPGDHRGVPEMLRRIVQDANESILTAARERGHTNGMGTTLTAAAICQDTAYFAQLGDSRAYLLRNGQIAQMTEDQSLVAELIAAGSITPEQAKSHPRRNVVLQALGVQPDIDVALSVAPLRRGDRLVLCSDGLWGKVDAAEMNELLQHLDLAAACESLVEMARERGGEDNITVIAANVGGDGLPEPEPGVIPAYKKIDARPRPSFWPWRRS
jgi:protein phosphatase